MTFLFNNRDTRDLSTAIYTKAIICQLGVLLINALFCVKYFSRYSDYYIVMTILLVTLLVFAFSSAGLLSKTRSVFLWILGSVVLLLYILLSTYIFYKVPVDNLNVDRWSVITSFWETYERGEYVYYAESNVGNFPGPMPFYFVIAYPFYKIGELGLFSLFTIPVFILLLMQKKAKADLIIGSLCLLICMPIVWWEILCRSNVFLNATLVLGSILFFFSKKQITMKNLVLSSILFGFLLSTRSVLAIAFVIACIFALKSAYISLKQLFVLGCVASATFVLTFLPFVYNHFSDFWLANPFIIQSSFLMPTFYTVFFIILAFAFGLICKSRSDVYFYTFVNLFLCILTYFLYQVGLIGFEEAVFGRVVDISYFILCVPFALYYIFQLSTKKT